MITNSSSVSPYKLSLPALKLLQPYLEKSYVISISIFQLAISIFKILRKYLFPSGGTGVFIGTYIGE
jgi:hypothetical protein